MFSNTEATKFLSQGCVWGGEGRKEDNSLADDLTETWLWDSIASGRLLNPQVRSLHRVQVLSHGDRRRLLDDADADPALW